VAPNESNLRPAKTAGGSLPDGTNGEPTIISGTAVAPAALDIDPVEIALGRSTPGPGGTTDVPLARAGVLRLCESSLAAAKGLLSEVRALQSEPDSALSWDTTLGKLDRVALAMRSASDLPGLLAVSHPDEGVRTNAKACEPKVDQLDTGLWLDAGIADVIKRYAKVAASSHPNLSPPKAKLLAQVLRNFRRNGLDLDAAGQARLRVLNERITQLGQDFESNVAQSRLFVDVSPTDLEGLPPEWIAAHKPDENGKVRITTDYPDYFPVLTYAKNREVALAIHKQFDNRATDKNLPILDEILRLRAEKAKLLGYASWADYVAEPRMAGSAKTIATFLGDLKNHIHAKAKEELREFRAIASKNAPAPSISARPTTTDDRILPSDRLYLEDRVRQTKYGLDSQELSQYFEVRKVKQGILDITSRMYGIRYRPAQLPTWHPDIEPMEVTDSTGSVIGRFYFDLYPREGKYKHAAVFGIRDSAKLPNGQRLVPIAAIECNFPRPSPSGPALLSHQDAVTFFHEFGHVLHHLLSESELASFAGTSVARDFVEAPSQMFEEWAWAKETLDVFAVHHATGKPMPQKLHDALLRSRSFGRAIATQRQLFLAALDQAYHTRSGSFDTTQVLREINDSYTHFRYVEGTHFQASFGHLIGYDAGYYGYQWALSIAQDLFTRFRKEGLLNTKTATEYRAAILAMGSSNDETKLVEMFLKRPPSSAAYKAFLVR